MTRKIALGMLLALLQRPATSQFGQTPPFTLPDSVLMLPGLVYREVDEQPLRLDVFAPRRDGTRPALVFVHGGRWGRSTKSSFWRQAAHLAQRGYIAITIELVAAGVRAELFLVEGADHGFFNRSPGYERTVDRMEKFLMDVLN